MQKRLVIALLLLINACRSESATLAPNVAQLVGIWELREPLSPYTTTLQLAFDTANPPRDITPFLVSGKVAVNPYDGRLSAALDGMMVFTKLGNAPVGTSASASFGQTYLANLKSVVRYEVFAPNRLRLHYGSPQPGVLEFEKLN